MLPPLLWVALTLLGCAVGVAYPIYRKKRRAEEQQEDFGISAFTQERAPLHDDKINRTWQLRKLREFETQLGVTLWREGDAQWLPTP
jgi:cbb3-type cytochrome oxidase subunit 3